MKLSWVAALISIASGRNERRGGGGKGGGGGAGGEDNGERQGTEEEANLHGIQPSNSPHQHRHSASPCIASELPNHAQR